jgi:hypothetical protein
MNERKVEILKCLSEGGWWATPQVAQDCGLSVTNASELLRRYRSQGLVNRRRNYDVPRGYFYRITGVGMGRLEFLSRDVTQPSHVLAKRAGLSGDRKRVFDIWVEQKLRR